MNREEISHWRRLLALGDVKLASERICNYGMTDSELPWPVYYRGEDSPQTAFFDRRGARFCKGRNRTPASLIGRSRKYPLHRRRAYRATPWSFIQHVVLHAGYLALGKYPAKAETYRVLPELADYSYWQPRDRRRFRYETTQRLYSEMKEVQEYQALPGLSGARDCLPPEFVGASEIYPNRCGQPLCPTCMATRIAKLCRRLYGLVWAIKRTDPNRRLLLFSYRCDYAFPAMAHALDAGKPRIDELFRDVIKYEPPDLRHCGKAAITLVLPRVSMRTRCVFLRVGMLGLIDADDYYPVQSICPQASDLRCWRLVGKRLQNPWRWAQAAALAFNTMRTLPIAQMPLGAAHDLSAILSQNRRALGVQAQRLLYAQDVAKSAAKWDTEPRNSRYPKISKRQYDGWLAWTRAQYPDFRPVPRTPAKPKPGVPYSDVL